MNLNPHYELRGKHAFLSPSSPYWLKYDKEKLIATWSNSQAKEMGTRLHALAAEMISLGVKLPRSKKTLNMYVNDSIVYGMSPEQPLYYSENCFGTSDALLFSNGYLRIFDLKTGETPAKMEQLKIYAALFCLEYSCDPENFVTELRIYQNNEVQIENPNPKDIRSIMDHIIWCDSVIRGIKQEEM